MSGGNGRPFAFLCSPPRGTGSLWFPGFLGSSGDGRLAGGEEGRPLRAGGQAVRAAFVNRAFQPFLKPAFVTGGFDFSAQFVRFVLEGRTLLLVLCL